MTPEEVIEKSEQFKATMVALAERLTQEASQFLASGKPLIEGEGKVFERMRAILGDSPKILAFFEAAGGIGVSKDKKAVPKTKGGNSLKTDVEQVHV